MSGFNVKLADGTTIKINAGEKLEDIKAKFGEEAQNVFEGIDCNNNGTLDTNEIDGLKAKFTENKYTVEVAEDGKTPKKAFNDAMQVMKNRYGDTLAENFKADESDKWEVKSGNTLWKIAKDILEDEGLPVDARSINDRIAQIAKLNNLKNVNNVRIGTKLIYKLTDAGVQKVKEAGNNSAAAFDGAVRRQKSSPAEGRRTGTVPVESLISGKESTIKVTPNGLDDNWDGILVKEKIDEKDVGKYTKTEGEETKEAYLIQMEDDVYLSAGSFEELQKLVNDYKAVLAKVKPEVANEAEDAKATRKSENLAALKELASLADNNVAALKLIASKLQDDTLIDITSDEYKAFVQDLILTRDADVLHALLHDNDDVTSIVISNDKTAHEYIAGLYQEIRAKEKVGERLTDEEIALKDVVAEFKGYNGYKIEADTEKGVHQKYMSYNNMDGTPQYQVEIGGNWYYAKDAKLLDEFLTKLEAADTDEKKTTLFKEYANTKDPELAKCLARNAQNLKASNDDILALLNSHGLEVINSLNTDSVYDKTVLDAVVARAKDIYTTDKGNLENAVYLEKVMAWIDKSDLSDDDKTKLKTEIADTYFEKDADGNYTFNPSRIPTQGEAYGLAYLPDIFKEAFAKYTKLDDMGKGRYNQGIENALYGTYTVPHYAEMVNKMETAEDVIDFIDNKVAQDRNYHLPYDKILEKFPDNPEIISRLAKYADDNSTISDANRVILVKQFMTADANGDFTFDPAKLPEGLKIDNVINILPKDCSKDGSAKLYDAILNSYTKVPDDGDESLNKLLGGHYRNVKEAPKDKEKLMKLVDTIKVGSANGNQLIDILRRCNLSEEEMAKLYAKCSDTKKRDMIEGGYTRNGALHFVKRGESIDKIVKNYLRTHLEKFPRLKKSVDSDPKKWTPERITEALDDYLKDFRADILKDLGISDPKVIQAGDIIDLDKIKWDDDDRQPGWWNYNFTY